MQSMVRSSTLHGYFDVARGLGLNPYELVQEVGLDAVALANPDERIPADGACRLLEATAAKASCSTLGLQIAQTRQQFGSGVINVLLAHKRTLREVLLAAAQYRYLLNEALGVYVETTGDTVTIREEIVAEPGTPTVQAIELAVGVLSRHSSALLGAHWKPHSVHFTHAAPPDLTFHRRFFGCPVTFESDFNGFVCAAADLDYPNPNADPVLVRYAENLANPLNSTAANSIALDVRTLQRQLDSAGSSFSGIVEEVRRDLAVRYLLNPRYPIGRVAALLGYTNQGAFTVWFQKRFGMTPREWRSRHRK
jgi:AraC-like DNA-binding protein